MSYIMKLKSHPCIIHKLVDNESLILQEYERKGLLTRKLPMSEIIFEARRGKE